MRGPSCRLSGSASPGSGSWAPLAASSFLHVGLVARLGSAGPLAGGPGGPLARLLDEGVHESRAALARAEDVSRSAVTQTLGRRD